jgi:hypothetical protein
MHYGRNTLSSNGEDTIRPKKPYSHYTSVIGQRDSLSLLDREGIRKLYSLMPILMKPEKGHYSATVHNLKVTWSTFPNVLEYQVQIAKDSTFVHIVDEQFMPNIDENRYALEVQTAVIKKLELATKYYWRVRCKTEDGFKSWSDISHFSTVWSRPNVYIDHQNIQVPSASLLQNYPNPFNSETNITFDLPKKGTIYLTIFNSAGQKVCTLLSGNQPSGRYNVNWNAKHCSNGIYYYRMDYSDHHITKKMLLIK